MSVVRVALALLCAVSMIQATRVQENEVVVAPGEVVEPLIDAYDTYILIDRTSFPTATPEDTEALAESGRLMAKMIMNLAADGQVGLGSHFLKDDKVYFDHHFVEQDVNAIDKGIDELVFATELPEHESIYDILKEIGEVSGTFRSDVHSSVLWIGDVAAPHVDVNTLEKALGVFKAKQIHLLMIDANKLNDDNVVDLLANYTDGQTLNLAEYVKEHAVPKPSPILLSSESSSITETKEQSNTAENIDWGGIFNTVVSTVGDVVSACTKGGSDKGTVIAIAGAACNIAAKDIGEVILSTESQSSDTKLYEFK